MNQRYRKVIFFLTDNETDTFLEINQDVATANQQAT